MGLPNPSRETKFSGANADREILIFPVQLTTSRIGNLTRLIHTLLYVMTIRTYIHTLAICVTIYCGNQRKTNHLVKNRSHKTVLRLFIGEDDMVWYGLHWWDG